MALKKIVPKKQNPKAEKMEPGNTKLQLCIELFFVIYIKIGTKFDTLI